MDLVDHCRPESDEIFARWRKTLPTKFLRQSFFLFYAFPNIWESVRKYFVHFKMYHSIINNLRSKGVDRLARYIVYKHLVKDNDLIWFSSTGISLVGATNAKKIIVRRVQRVVSITVSCVLTNSCCSVYKSFVNIS